MFVDTTTLSAFRPPLSAPARTATVEYNHGFASRGMPWQLRCYGSGKSTVGLGIPGHYRDEALARRKAACWIATGVAAADQGDVSEALRPVELVTATIQDADPRLLELLFADRPLTPAEWAEVDLFEEMAA